MKLLVKDSGLHGLKASIDFCVECQKPQVHYTTTNGWPVCHVCGYNAELAQLFEDDLPIAPQPADRFGSKAA
jgi:hypothetical protein